MLSVEYIEMYLAQLLQTISEAQKKTYDTARIKVHLDQLEAIAEFINNTDLRAKTQGELAEINIILDYISICMSYIPHSTKDDVPLEVFFALRDAMRDWLPDSDKYVFVSNEGPFCITTFNWNQNLYKTIKAVTNIDIIYRFVFFSVPAHLKGDYLCNIPLYHELGHFVDKCYSISHIITNVLAQKVRMTHNVMPNEYKKYFNNSSEWPVIMSYFMEYFADLFSAQYLGRNSYTYLNCIGSANGFSKDHPSTKIRIEVVDDFLNGVDNPIVRLFQIVCSKYGKQLKIRSQVLDLNCFFDGQCYPMKDASDIHGIFMESWNLWMHKRDKFKKEDGSLMRLKDAYNFLNDKIEKSVKNYRNKIGSTINPN